MTKFSPCPILDFRGTVRPATCCFATQRNPQPAVLSLSATVQGDPLRKVLSVRYFRTFLKDGEVPMDNMGYD